MMLTCILDELCLNQNLMITFDGSEREHYG